MVLTRCGNHAGDAGASDKAAHSHRIAGIFAGSTRKAGWGVKGLAGLKDMATAVGTDQNDVGVVDLPSYERAAIELERLSEQGYDIVVAHSSGFEPAMLEVA